LAATGYKVGVIDSDPNISFHEWFQGYEGPAVRCAAEARDVQVVDLAQSWAEELDVVVIDTAGFGNLTAAAAMGCADHVLVPCMPDRGSTREAAKTVAKISSLARAARRAIGASIVLSQWRVGGIAERATLEDLVDYGMPSILKTVIPERTALRRMSFDSKAVVSGPIGHVMDMLIAELVEIRALDGLARLGDIAA